MFDKIQIIKGNLIDINADAIINSINILGETDKNISEAAGPRYLDEFRTLNNFHNNKSQITLGYCLPARYIIHTAVPKYDKQENNHILLAKYFRNSLTLATFYPINSIAFPDISSKENFPIDFVAQIAFDEIKNFLDNDQKNIEKIFIVCDNEYTQKYYLEFLHNKKNTETI